MLHERFTVKKLLLFTLQQQHILTSIEVNPCKIRNRILKNVKSDAVTNWQHTLVLSSPRIMFQNLPQNNWEKNVNLLSFTYLCIFLKGNEASDASYYIAYCFLHSSYQRGQFVRCFSVFVQPCVNRTLL